MPLRAPRRRRTLFYCRDGGWGKGGGGLGNWFLLPELVGNGLFPVMYVSRNNFKINKNVYESLKSFT